MVDLNKQCSVLLTSRDFSVLKSLYDNVVMSFVQISGLHFVNKSKPTIVNRLTKLERAGFIQKLRIPRLEVMGSQGAISVVFQITKFGIHVLQKRHPEIEFRPESIKIRPYSVDHDLLLVDVTLALRNKFPDHRIIHGELYFTSQRPSGLKPDIILVGTKDNGVVAIELELTAKSEKRYRELILKYRLSKEFSKVIYITSHQQIENKIKAILGASQVMGKFEFLQLKDILFSNNERKTLLDKPVENNNLAHQYDVRQELTV